jgi:hypothetical protein
MISKNESGDLYLYIIPHEASAEVLHWGQEVSMEQTMQSINKHIDSLRARSG